MVSFSCENCGDVLTKKKLDSHRQRCRGATFSCIDCMTHFLGTDYRSHTACISEAQKYQGPLYKSKNKKLKSSHPPPEPPQPLPILQQAQPRDEADDIIMATDAVAHKAYVEEVPDEYDEYEGEWEDHDDDSDDQLPEAPTPPSGNGNPGVNVFDFYVGAGTPNASSLNLPRTAVPSAPVAPAASVRIEESTDLVCFNLDPVDASKYMIDDDDRSALVQYGTGPVPTDGSAYQTPAQRSRKKSDSSKKDKKRKRLHVDTGDRAMSDAPPPALHTGLTGGLNRLMTRNVFPPSPDNSSGDAETPASPLKKSRHTKGARKASSLGLGEGISNNIMSLINSGSKSSKHKSLSKKQRKVPSVTRKTRHSQSHRLEGDKPQRLLEYRPASSDSGKENADKQMIVYKPPAELFLSFVTKGPDSEKGCSMNKALKRWHREMTSNSLSDSPPLGKIGEEKELWRSLRLRKNERGEIVLFTA